MAHGCSPFGSSAHISGHLLLSEEEAIHAIRSLRSIVHGFSSLEVAGGFGMPVDLDASFHWLIHLFIAGLQRSRVKG